MVIQGLDWWIPTPAGPRNMRTLYLYLSEGATTNAAFPPSLSHCSRSNLSHIFGACLIVPQ